MKQNFQHILVYGVGGVGGYFGGLLANALNKGPVGGRQVHFIARGAHLRAIQEKGLTLKTSNGQELRCLPNTASDDPTPLPMVDLVLLCVKGCDLPDALDKIKDKVTSSTVILPLLNGMDINDRIRNRLDKGILLPACVYISSRVSAPGEITQIGPAGKILTGNTAGRRDLYPESLLMLALQAGWHIEWVERPEEAIWEKYLFIAPLALVTASLGLSIGEVLEDTAGRIQVEAMMHEVAALAEARGVRLPEDAVDRALAVGTAFPRETRTSFQQDVEAKKSRNEKDLFGGAVIRMGKAAGIPTPETEKILKTLENIPG